MSRSTKYHAELFFKSDRFVRFTAIDLDLLMKRFAKEVDAEVDRRREAREYTYVEPTLIVEVCDSWAEFDQYEHHDGRAGAKKR
jgi:hypothetical protein